MRAFGGEDYGIMESCGTLLKTPEREECAKWLFEDEKSGCSAELDTSKYFSQSGEEYAQAFASPQVIFRMMYAHASQPH